MTMMIFLNDNNNIVDDTLPLVWEAMFTPGHAIYKCCMICMFFIIITFLTSTITKNYSQVDKLWSILPVIYVWQLVIDTRTLIMAGSITIWGLSLTYNFYRRGGYKSWPPWSGEEDYRWSILQTTDYIPYLRNRFVWFLFNLVFISTYQNILLLLIVTPSMVAHVVATTTSSSNSISISAAYWGDWLVFVMILLFVLIQSIADNQQYAFQTEKYRQRDLGIMAEGDYADGFCQTGLFQFVRKPNYAAEQAIWMSYYFFSVIATGGPWLNWSACGWILLVALFQGSGNITEYISCQKYPKYSNYQRRVPLYIPRIPFHRKKPKPPTKTP